MRGRVAQLTDTHIVREGSAYLGIDTSRYLSDALEAVSALEPLPDYIVVTGDLVNSGGTAQYERFHEIMSHARLPYFVIPGNHDDRATMRATLAPETYGRVAETKLHFTIDGFAIRFIGLDCNRPRPWPGALADAATLEWLDAVLAQSPGRPTIVAVHQPPFKTGLHYLDVAGFIGRSRLRRVVDRHPHVRAVISGHIHCVRSVPWANATASTAASTSPQPVPLLFTQRRIIGIAHESAGFAIHDLHDDGSFVRTDYRRDGTGRYLTDRDANALGANTKP
jgi:Icc protein